MVLRVLPQMAKRRLVSMAHIFLDVRAAFDSVDRSLVMPSATQQAASIIESFGIAPDFAAQLVDLHISTRCEVKGCDSVVEIFAGSSKGGPPATSYTTSSWPHWSRVSTPRSRGTTSKELVHTMREDSWSRTTIRKRNTWRSQMCRTATTRPSSLRPPPLTLAAHTSAALAVIHEVFTKFNLELNFGPGKFEVLAFYNVPGPKAAKHNRFVTMSKHTPLERSDWNFDRITVSNEYKHLGGNIATNGAMTPEARARARRLWEEVSPLMKRFFCGSGVPTKISLLHSLVIAMLLYSAGIWPKIADSDVAILERPIVNMLRVCASTEFVPVERLILDEEVFARATFPRVRPLLMQARIRALGRIVAYAPRQLLAVVQAALPDSRSWAHMVRQDLQLMWVLEPKLDALASPSLRPSEWIRLITEHPHEWNRIVRSFFKQIMGLVARPSPPPRPRRALRRSQAKFLALIAVIHLVLVPGSLLIGGRSIGSGNQTADGPRAPSAKLVERTSTPARARSST